MCISPRVDDGIYLNVMAAPKRTSLAQAVPTGKQVPKRDLCCAKVAPTSQQVPIRDLCPAQAASMDKQVPIRDLCCAK
ncbi:MAG TPA: hypothetical protein DCK78_01520, partial [Paenibacillus lactis]|nr:hypothetical protein [Paenibacillus lactis]